MLGGLKSTVFLFLFNQLGWFLFWGLGSTWQKVGMWARSHCQVSRDESRWQFQSGPQMALAVNKSHSGELSCVKDKFQIEQGPHVEELATGNSKDFHLILVYLLPQTNTHVNNAVWYNLQCIEVRVLGGKASVGSHIGEENHLGKSNIQRNIWTIVTIFFYFN